MKLLFFLFLLICEISCSQNNTAIRNKEVINIYTTGKDSVFYAEGEKFDPANLVRGTKNDSAFIKTLIRIISDTNKTILFKPLAGDRGGAGKVMVNMMFLFERNNIRNIMPSLIDSTEKKYFNDISFLEDVSRPPETLVVKAPTSVSTKSPGGKFLLTFLLTKDDRIYYKYDSSLLDKNFIQIKPNTTEKIVQIISDLEKINKIKFNEENIFIKGDASFRYSAFKKIKDALKQKEIFKFRIVTTQE